jgi:cell division protein FtsL
MFYVNTCHKHICCPVKPRRRRESHFHQVMLRTKYLWGFVMKMILVVTTLHMTLLFVHNQHKHIDLKIQGDTHARMYSAETNKSSYSEVSSNITRGTRRSAILDDDNMHRVNTNISGEQQTDEQRDTKSSAVLHDINMHWVNTSISGKEHTCGQARMSWNGSNGLVMIVPTEGFGNRMRVLAAGIYIARTLQRNLSVVWPQMQELHTTRTGSVSFVMEPIPASCHVIDCHKQPSVCEKNFRTLTLEKLFPHNKRCIVIKTFSPLDKYLLDNSNTHAQLMMQRNSFPPADVFKDFLCTLIPSIHHEFCGLTKQLSIRNISFALHLRTGADPVDGGKIKHLYKPQLRCLSILQRHFASQNLSSTIFLETDAAVLKDPSMLESSFEINGVLTLPIHANRENTRATLLLWILLHEADVSLTSHRSSIGMTGAERTGGPLPYALPNNHIFSFVNEGNSEATRECESPLGSTATYDLVHVLVPSECTDIFPGCPSVPVGLMLSMMRTWRQTHGFMSRDWCV